MSHSLPIDVISDRESRPPITFATTLHTNTSIGALIVAISHQFPPLSTVIIYKKVVCGGLGWFAVVCGGLRYFDGADIGSITVCERLMSTSIAINNNHYLSFYLSTRNHQYPQSPILPDNLSVNCVCVAHIQRTLLNICYNR